MSTDPNEIDKLTKLTSSLIRTALEARTIERKILPNTIC